MSNNFVIVAKIIPLAQRIVPMRLHGSNHAESIRRQIGCKQIGWKRLLNIQLEDEKGGPINIPLCVAADSAAPRDQPGFRLIGGETTAGISFLFGEGPGGGMVHCPVDLEWIQRHLRWATAEECNIEEAERELQTIRAEGGAVQ